MSTCSGSMMVVLAQYGRSTLNFCEMESGSRTSPIRTAAVVDKELEPMMLPPGTLIRWIADGDVGFVLRSYVGEGAVEIEILWLLHGISDGNTTIEEFPHFQDLVDSMDVLSEPTYNRDAS